MRYSHSATAGFARWRKEGGRLMAQCAENQEESRRVHFVEREREIFPQRFSLKSAAERMDGAGVVMPAGVGKTGDISLEL